MKNFEKYETEIKQLDYNFAVTKDNKVVNCNHIKCKDCELYNPMKMICKREVVKWLYRESKEDE